ncbi:hypothetical protein NDU88_001592 [Pleurodeles waltl]|uniref:Uncharacterized protein n=1 Tax=Pleurodeles waltl TaxID=8319 RepID=A0AAV7RBQ5_PLEWA|nr:hypothetical protein NDU88_001592 [Pleurodeles waltl]
MWRGAGEVYKGVCGLRLDKCRRKAHLIFPFTLTPFRVPVFNFPSYRYTTPVAGSDFPSPRGTAWHPVRPLPVSGGAGREVLQPPPRARVFKEFSLLQQAAMGGAQRRGGSAPQQRCRSAEQTRAQCPSPAPLAGPGLLLHGLWLRRGSVSRRQAPGGVSLLRAASAWAADAAAESTAWWAAQRLNGARELRCVDAAARSSPGHLDVRRPTPSEEVMAPQTGCL